jgi:RNA polymerase sigma factor (sigma-70 family)
MSMSTSVTSVRASDKQHEAPRLPSIVREPSSLTKALHHIREVQEFSTEQAKGLFNEASPLLLQFITSELERHFPTIQYAERDNITQMVLLKTWTKLGQFQLGAEAAAWLASIVRNQAIDSLRSLKRRGEEISVDSIFEDCEGLRDYAFSDRGATNPSSLAELKEIQGRLQDMVNTLPEGQRALLFLWAEGHSYKEIQKVVALPLTTIKARLFDARKELSSRFGQDFKRLTGNE